MLIKILIGHIGFSEADTTTVADSCPGICETGKARALMPFGKSAAAPYTWIKSEASSHQLWLVFRSTMSMLQFLNRTHVCILEAESLWT